MHKRRLLILQYTGVATMKCHQVPDEMMCASGCSLPVLQASVTTWLPPGFSCSFTTLTMGTFFFHWGNSLTQRQSLFQETLLEWFVHVE